MQKILCGLVLSLGAVTAHAGPNINITSFYDYLAGDKTTFLKRIYNVGDSTAFVRVSVFEITFDADGKAIETPVQGDAKDAAQRQGLIASPARLIIPSQGMQATRLLYIGDRGRERYYRVRYTPVMPEQEDQFAVSKEERDAYAQSMSAGVNIMAGYGAVFFVRPKETRFATQVENLADTYRVQNAGNSTVELDEFKDCASAKRTECLPTRKHILRPGMSFSFDKQAGRTYTFDLVEGEQSKKVEVKK